MFLLNVGIYFDKVLHNMLQLSLELLSSESLPSQCKKYVILNHNNNNNNNRVIPVIIGTTGTISKSL